MVLRKMMELSITDFQKIQTWLLIGAIFFAMRSCEYLRTTYRKENKRTKIIQLKNIIFKNKGKVVKHDSNNLVLSEMVMITFEFQKNNVRNKSVHMFSTGDDLLCPVVAWANTVQRILSTIPSASKHTKVSEFNDRGTVKEMTSAIIRARLRNIVAVIGKEILGFTKDEVGLHSIRSGGAMAMFLSGVPEIVIQRVGRWESTAFMEYIREQVETFTYGVSKSMLKHESFFHLNNANLSNDIEDNSEKTIERNQTNKGNGKILSVPYNIKFRKDLFENKKEL